MRPALRALDRRWTALAGVAVTGVAAAGLVAVGPVHSAGAAADGSDGPGATVTVGASSGGSGGGAPGGAPRGPTGSGGGGNPWICTYTELTLNDGGGFAPGGPTPGSWYSVTCTDQLTGVSVTQTEWITAQAAPGTPAVDPYAVARQAERSLRLPSPSNHFDPTVPVVNLPTWLWIDPGVWHPYRVTASVGSVTATAVATPVTVTWSMGDGGSVTCDGPGTPFDPSEPAQESPCSYLYPESSAGQPSPDGNPDDGAFVVVATIHWSVTWSVTGAAGGGALPALATSTPSLLRVEQVESITTQSASAGGGPGGGPGGGSTS